MCFGGSPKVDNSALIFQQQEAARARAEEEARKRRIDEGMAHIAAIFDGGEYAPVTGPIEATKVTGVENPEYAAALKEYQENQPAAGSETNYAGPALPPQYLPSVAGASIGDLIVPDNLARGETQTYQGMQPVLDTRRSALEGFLVPQLDNQYDDARDDLTFALARAGQLTSSVAGQRQADLSQDFALNRADVDSRVQGDVAQTRNRMNQQRQSLEAALRSSGDQTAAGNSALAAATTFRQDTPTLSPLGNIFAGVGTGIGAIRQGYENGRIKRLATPNPLSSNAGRVVNG